MQYAVLEFVRSVLGEPATHAESDGEADDNVVTALACSLYGEERVVTPVAGTRFDSWVDGPFTGMHFCNYAPTADGRRAARAGRCRRGCHRGRRRSRGAGLPGPPVLRRRACSSRTSARWPARRCTRWCAPSPTLYGQGPPVREGEPSRTAFGAAVYRAVHQDLDGGRIFRDPLAWQILGVDREETLSDPAATDRGAAAGLHRGPAPLRRGLPRRRRRARHASGRRARRRAWTPSPTATRTPAPRSSRSTSRRPAPGSASGSRTPASPYPTT